MNRREVERIVDRCVDDIAAGRRTVQECLDAHPELRAELEPLLQAAVAFSGLATVPERAVDPERRAQFMAELRRTPQEVPGGGLPLPRLPSFSLPAWASFGALGVGRVAGVVAPAAAIALVALAFVLARPSDPASASTLTVFSGTVEQLRDGRWAPVEDGARIEEGAHLRTAGESRALITFLDGSTASLAPRTEVVLERMRINGTREVTIEQRAGRIWNDVAPFEDDTSTYVIRTPDAVVQGDETVFETVIEEGETSVTTVLGRVSVRAGSDVVDLAAGDVVQVRGQEIAARAQSDGADVQVQAPFVASVFAEDGAATGARPDGVIFRQVPGISTTDPGEGPQAIELINAPPGLYTLWLRRFDEGEGNVVIETSEGQRVIPVEPGARAVKVRVKVAIEDGKRSIEVESAEVDESDGDDEPRERIVPSRRTEKARPVAERRREHRDRGRGPGLDDGGPPRGPGNDRSEAPRPPDFVADLLSAATASPTVTSTTAATATVTATATATPRATATATGTPSADPLERIERFLAALEQGDIDQAAEELEAIAESNDQAAAAALREALAGLDGHLERWARAALDEMSGGDRDRLFGLLGLDDDWEDLDSDDLDWERLW